MRDLERLLSQGLRTAVLLAIAEESVDVCSLTGYEARCLADMAEVRRPSWLLGRAALKALLARAGEPLDTGALAFPHPWLSLTHSGSLAAALALPGAHPPGAGIDLETGRSPHPDSARFFLTPSEQAWLAALDPKAQPRHLQRLWTVKEALFKARLQNQDAMLHHFEIDDPSALSGTAVLRCGGRPRFRYTSATFRDCWLTAAVPAQ